MSSTVTWLSAARRPTAEELRDLQGGMFLFNHRHSNSGMNLPRRGLADIADGRPLFASVVETGSQPGNLDRIARFRFTSHRQY
jgi:ABC-type phosphate/phosphonate transport system substrate-binding protein